MSSSENKPRSHKKPVPDKQLAANRANAAKSTGPTSEPGKARSSQNACKHGLSSASFTVIRLEDIEEIDRLDLISVYQPVNSQELFALEQVALREQGMLRAARFEAGLFSARLNECLESDGSAASLSTRTSPTASKSSWPRIATTCWLMASSAWPARASAFNCSWAIRLRPSASTGARSRISSAARSCAPSCQPNP